MRAIENGMVVPQIRADSTRFWIGRLKGLPRAASVTDIVERSAAVPIEGFGDTDAALQYGDHGSSKRPSREILEKVFDDVRFGRAFVSPRRVAGPIKDLRMPLMRG